MKRVGDLLMSANLLCVKEDRGSDLDDDIPTCSSLADAIAFSLENLDPQKWESLRLAEESHASAAASDASVGPLNRELVKILRAEVSFEANNHSSHTSIFIHWYHPLQIEKARSARKHFDEGRLLLILSNHFVDCQMYPLAAKILEESLVAFRREELEALDPNLHSSCLACCCISERLARLYHLRCRLTLLALLPFFRA